MLRILMTGSSGFIGNYLGKYLLSSDSNYEVINTYRNDIQGVTIKEKNAFIIGEINSQTNWQQALQNIDVVIHLAARVHIMQEISNDPLQEFIETNSRGTINLAQQALKSGVKRFIYLSSIKVNGEETINRAFTADDNNISKDPYAYSKHLAEQELLTLAKQSNLEVVIIRPPLVYGPGVKGNLQRLITLVKKEFPLPLAGIENQRSIVGIENLCDFIQTCIHHPAAINEIFLVKDKEDISTTTLIKLLARAMDKKVRLFYLPKKILLWIFSIIGKENEISRLLGSLQIDITKNKQRLNWEPKISTIEGLKDMIKHQ
ncbi:MAG: NAD-dependent epimerase/dehydratase family protein [Gammaproteobacteria bacterium]|nr:NAD-dependent epimerase/dehydratase family protein [Gammaproteobacteria bacterium]